MSPTLDLSLSLKWTETQLQYDDLYSQMTTASQMVNRGQQEGRSKRTKTGSDVSQGQAWHFNACHGITAASSAAALGPTDCVKLLAGKLKAEC